MLFRSWVVNSLHKCHSRLATSGSDIGFKFPTSGSNIGQQGTLQGHRHHILPTLQVSRTYYASSYSESFCQVSLRRFWPRISCFNQFYSVFQRKFCVRPLSHHHLYCQESRTTTDGLWDQKFLCFPTSDRITD